EADGSSGMNTEMLEDQIGDAATLNPEEALKRDGSGSPRQATDQTLPGEGDTTAKSPAAAEAADENGGGGGTHAEPDPRLPRAPYLKTRLEDAERLLAYAADSGQAIDEPVRKQVFAARVAQDSDRWTESIAQ